MMTLEADGTGLPVVASATSREIERSLRRLRRRRRAARRRLRIAGGAAGFGVLLVLVFFGTRQVALHYSAPPVAALVPHVPIDLGGMILEVEGTSDSALAQGYRDCVSEPVRIVCRHPDPVFIGIRATSLSLALTGPNGMRDAEDVREAGYLGMTFRFADLGPGGFDRLDTALRGAGWQRPAESARRTYYRPGVPATITLAPDITDGSISATVRPSEKAFVEAQLRLIQIQAQDKKKRDSEVKALIARMNGLKRKAATSPPSGAPAAPARPAPPPHPDPPPPPPPPR